jgi:hypothetical protein
VVSEIARDTVRPPITLQKTELGFTGGRGFFYNLIGHFLGVFKQPLEWR